MSMAMNDYIKLLLTEDQDGNTVVFSVPENQMYFPTVGDVVLDGQRICRVWESMLCRPDDVELQLISRLTTIRAAENAFACRWSKDEANE